ncbi:hypothetical protein QW131_13545 [Roseibium salinum]|nr:hypothetical protein [Roseibium salinum]
MPFGLSAAALTLRATGALADDLSWDALQTFLTIRTNSRLGAAPPCTYNSGTTCCA